MEGGQEATGRSVSRVAPVGMRARHRLEKLGAQTPSEPPPLSLSPGRAIAAAVPRRRYTDGMRIRPRHASAAAARARGTHNQPPPIKPSPHNPMTLKSFRFNPHLPHYCGSDRLHPPHFPGSRAPFSPGHGQRGGHRDGCVYESRGERGARGSYGLRRLKIEGGG